MSDIVEMLVDAAGGNEVHVCAIAAAEIKRLRKELEREKEEHDRCATFHAIAVKERNYERVLALKRDEEIERLREGERAADAEIERLRGTQCNWTDEGGDCWETDCGHGFQFNDGGPADNSFTHCPFCGGKLIVVQVDE